MTTQMHTNLTAEIDTAARVAGLKIVANEPGTDYNGAPTVRFTLATTLDEGSNTLLLELSAGFDISQPALLSELTQYLKDAAKRLRNPLPGAAVTLSGMPISFGHFEWPFHHSTSGADTLVVHGQVHLEDGEANPLHAKVAASVTQTFAEIIPAPEQPYAESFIFNAIRKTLDRGQLEMLKSGNRQPVPVTTRYYSRWQKKFLFTETAEDDRHEFLALKIYWLSGVTGNGAPVWIADPRDAQYLNCEAADLESSAKVLASEGLITLVDGGDYAAATPALLELKQVFDSKLHTALEFTKPAFNEEMRAGHTNM
jgi:hypothetical protein